MTTDLIAVLADGTFEEQIVEISAFLSRSHPEASRNEYITKYQQLALEAEPASTDPEAEAPAGDAAKKQQVIQQVVSEFKTLGEGSDRELEGIYNLLSSLILANFDSQDTFAPLFKTLIAAISTSREGQTEKNLVRYRILSNLYNALPSTSPLRLDLFNALLSLTSSNDDLDYLASALTSLPRWLAEWQVDESAKAQCLENVANALQNAEKEHAQTSKAYQFLTLHLRYISTLSSSSKTTEAAERTIASALRLPKLFEFEDLLQIKAVLDLKGTPIFDLLKIFVGGSTKDYQSWESSNSAELSRLGLSQTHLLQKIRLLDLADLCAQSISSDVKYADIAKTLDISEEDVETWVIDVIRAGLVSGKLSQVKNTFRVYKSTHRQFEKAQWQLLEKRLVQWQSSINNIIESIANTRGGKIASITDNSVETSA